MSEAAMAALPCSRPDRYKAAAKMATVAGNEP
ncbi:MAG: hypothetical protein QOI12_1410 [Alphaproteobacteria bacterium]|jgi:hypothetical protein|nr:hypothetical protein [Alphaproteobacteria bacterium]